MACWVAKNGPLTLVAKTRSNPASVAVATGPAVGDPGVVDQDVEAAIAPPGRQLGVERLEEPAELLDRADVGLEGERLAPGRLDLADGRLGPPRRCRDS